MHFEGHSVNSSRETDHKRRERIIGWTRLIIHVTIHSESNSHISFQFLTYSSYFAAISLLFTVRGVYTVLHMKCPAGGNQVERATNLPEDSCPWGPSETLKNMRILIIAVISYYTGNQQHNEKILGDLVHNMFIKILSPTKSDCGSYSLVCHQQDSTNRFNRRALT